MNPNGCIIEQYPKSPFFPGFDEPSRPSIFDGETIIP